jgi:hypothetical protein
LFLVLARSPSAGSFNPNFFYLASIDAKPCCFRENKSPMPDLSKGEKSWGFATIMARLALLPELGHSKLQASCLLGSKNKKATEL